MYSGKRLRTKKERNDRRETARHHPWTTDESSADEAIEVYRPRRGAPFLQERHPEMFQVQQGISPVNEDVQIDDFPQSPALAVRCGDDMIPENAQVTNERNEHENTADNNDEFNIYEDPGVPLRSDEEDEIEDEDDDDTDRPVVDDDELNLGDESEYLVPSGWTGQVIVEHPYCSDGELYNPAEPRLRDYEDLLLPYQDVGAGFRIAEEVAKLSENFEMKLVRVWMENCSITKTYKSDMLKLIKSATPADLEKLHVDPRGLMKCIPVGSLSCWISHVCFGCKRSLIYKHHVGLRKRLSSLATCHGQVLDYNSDHYLVADVSEVLALVLPSIWAFRSVEYLPPHIEKVMRENDMDFRTDITLTVSSDGVQFFKSSSLSTWPFMAFVDGIPHQLQRKSIMLLGALAARSVGKYFQVNCMVDDILRQIERLNKDTFSWIYKGETIRSRVLVSRVIADSPARAAIQGINGFNATFGCNYCLHCQRLAYFTHFKRPSVARTDGDIRDWYANPDFDSIPVEERYGLKWKSKFERLPFDLVDGFPPDVMHALYIGVMKLLIEQWLSKAHKDDDGKEKRRPFQLTKATVRFLDSRLLNIRPPERTSRRPREISKAGMWKAHECSMFLFYYGPIIMKDILPSEYYDHYIDLVAGASLLSSKITPAHVAQAQEHLDRFSAKIEKLYSARCRRFNVHLLRHMPRFCELHGILPLFSMSPFESENHRLGTYVNGSHAVLIQLFQKSMERLILNCREDAFKKRIRSQGWLEWECLADPLMFSGVRNLETRSQGTSYYQVYYPPNGKPRIVSKAYSALKKRNGCMVMLANGNVAEILMYFVGSLRNSILAIVEEFEVSRHDVLGHIRYLGRSLGKCVIPVTSFMEQVVRVDCGDTVGCALYLNNIEHVAE